MDFVAAGIPVFPCRNKVPLVRGGVYEASAAEEQIALWSERWADAQIGVPCDTPEWPVAVVDIDVDSPLAEILSTDDQPLWTGDALAEAESAPGQRTPGGGRHILYLAPGADQWRNSVSALAQGVDTRGAGGYIIAYDLAIAQAALTAPPVPERLLKVLAERPKPEPVELPVPAGAPAELGANPLGAKDSGAATELGQAWAHLLNAQPGARNDALNKVAFLAGQYAAHERIDEQAALAALSSARPDLVRDDGARSVAATIRGGFSSGKADAGRPNRPQATATATKPRPAAPAPSTESGADDGRKDGRRQMLSEIAGVWITRVIKYPGEPSYYQLECKVEDRLKRLPMQGVECITNYARFRDVLAEGMQVLVPHYTPAKWLAVTEMLLELVETESAGLEGTAAGDIPDWIYAYLETHKPYPEDKQQSAILEGEPFLREGWLHIRTNYVVRFLRSVQQERNLRTRDLTIALKRTGWEHYPVTINHPETGRPITRRTWRIKEDEYL